MSHPDALTRTVRASYRLAAAASGFLEGLVDGLWLGLLDAQRLTALDLAYYDRERMYQDEAYNRRGLFEWEQQLVDMHFPVGARVTVLGAGGGREVMALLGQGFDAVGFEPHPALAAFGARLTAADGHGARVHPCPRDAWPSAAPPADVVVFGWGSYMLIRGRRQRVERLRAAAATLPPGGRVVVSFFARRGTPLRFRVSHRIGTAIRRLRGREPVDLGDALVPNYVHFFTERQITDELAEAGLTTLSVTMESYGRAVGEVSAALAPASAG